MDMFEKWDNQVDMEGLKKDIAEAAANGGQGNYKEVPHGDYEVSIKNMELKASKKGDPMVSIWFQIVSGEFENSVIFFNQVITQGFQIHIADEMLRSLVSGMDAPIPVEFQNYKQYGQLILDIFEATSDFEYALAYKKGKKDFSTYEITDVFALD